MFITEQAIEISFYDYFNDDMDYFDPICGFESDTEEGNEVFVNLMAKVYTQPLSCSDSWDGWIDSVKFQTIQCVP